MLKIFGWLWRSILFLLGIDHGMRGTSNVDRDAELKSQFKLISHEVISDMQKTFLATAELQFKAQQQLNDIAEAAAEGAKKTSEGFRNVFTCLLGKSDRKSFCYPPSHSVRIELRHFLNSARR